MKRIYLNIILLSCIFGMVTACADKNNDESDFDNKIYLTTKSKSTEILLKGMNDSISRELFVGSALPVGKEVKVKFGVEPSLLNKFNEAYYENAILLNDRHYRIPDAEAVMSKGSVESTPLKINFIELKQLSKDTVYVLPVSIISSDGMDLLLSGKTQFFVFKGAALINVVGDVNENFLKVNWKHPSVVQNITELTIEGLLRPRDFNKMISTMLGVEGYFLLRFGDANFPAGQLQIATKAGNFPSADSKKELPLNQWTHVALTLSKTTGEYVVYVNGKEQSKGQRSFSGVSFDREDFFLGKSYDNNRFFAGDFSEFRIWNIVRTQEEIAANPYYVDPKSEGLVAYWKFDEGAGSLVKDHANGNDAIADKPLKWLPVSLPEKK